MVPWYWYLLLGFIDVQANFLGGSAPLIGDALVIAGTLGYALSNVGELGGSVLFKLSILNLTFGYSSFGSSFISRVSPGYTISHLLFFLPVQMGLAVVDPLVIPENKHRLSMN
ncbi:hypothetical protein MKW98_006822 [Papaver atlanticum]|uniref:Uncharacterized protein n=1 Tax=Papaver atlanticum TaxID=357466 RepID=A0AAD4XKA6_9MAGN|nr:hypothetical protein MKW98_006822 [Papaver atlanticum]